MEGCLGCDMYAGIYFGINLCRLAKVPGGQNGKWEGTKRPKGRRGGQAKNGLLLRLHIIRPTRRCCTVAHSRSSLFFSSCLSRPAALKLHAHTAKRGSPPKNRALLLCLVVVVRGRGGRSGDRRGGWFTSRCLTHLPRLQLALEHRLKSSNFPLPSLNEGTTKAQPRAPGVEEKDTKGTRGPLCGTGPHIKESLIWDWPKSKCVPLWHWPKHKFTPLWDWPKCKRVPLWDWKPGGGPTQCRGHQRSGGSERVVAGFRFCGARGRVGVGVALKRLPVPTPAFRSRALAGTSRGAQLPW
jgi:hypothetical protein